MDAIYAILISLGVMLPASTLVVTTMPPDDKGAVVFYVKEATNSPYQGLLKQDEVVGLTADALKTKQLEQFAAWKANLIALQAAAAANPPVEDVPQ